MKNHIKIFAGNANRPLAEKIAARVGMPLSVASIGRFPDGEISVTYEETVRGRDVFIIQPTGMTPNEYLMELLIMTDAARRASARRITAVMPFFAYARQDRKERSRVPISAKLVANLLVAAGVDRVLTMDLHSPQIQGFFDIPVDHLYAAPLLVRYLREKVPVENRMVVAPDPGGLKMAYSYMKLLDAGLALTGKHRTSATQVEAFQLVGDVKGKDCILVDDMTTTAGTLAAAAELTRKQGARSVRAAVTHCPITPLGIQRLKESAIEELITTDSIEPQDWGDYPITILTVADLLGDAIKRIYADESVSKLFEIHQGRTQ
ncbi:MAG: ribose-phosphate pyrophosphokinase [Kiritimatiellae bacterium]|jgi:ribose-phosphate pyrophosphokinase|nr:ribose-phosphate pyrophosphokinase [Kiritimatiellia bacterium]NLD88971.1 ribose-phosphate pyrophosphokinase [Lentisphaerota bacterium]HOU21066.1 ribose-phosphate pyrophosphokinase [Kiritimatiellia bacterium]HPC19299.1 ribose-phosphate pyrophosphokinase [Kiritimatiellia bacterium]HQN79689.1 ribose-phosphate pyrophosphokinase [Kiritimatiellia bacterium]